MKSFARQIAQIVSHFAYKTNNMRFIIKPQLQPHHLHPRLTYKIDIAHKLYQRYKDDQFKFSQKGVTPKSIAEEIIIYIFDCKDYKIDIDSFGYILITPTQHYYDKLQHNIINLQKINHQCIDIKHIEHVKKNQSMMLLNELNDLSLQSLRIHHHLSFIKRKSILFGQYNHQDIKHITNIQKLNQKNVDYIIKNKVINDVNVCILNVNNKSIFANNIKLINRIQDLQLNDYSQSIGATFRHHYIDFYSRYHKILKDQSQILTFGSIKPHFVVDGIEEPVMINKIKRILNKTLQYDNKMSIDLTQSDGLKLSLSKQTSMISIIQNRTHQERLLILLDLLQNNQFSELIFLLQKLDKKSNANPYKPIMIFNNQLKQLLS